MSELKIELSTNQTGFEPGEQINGTVSLTCEPPTRTVELRLFWFTRGKGTEDANIVETARFDQPQPYETRSFAFRLPAAPYSFSGKLISLVWALELITFPGKQVIRREIEVGPAGREVKLEALADPGLAQRWVSIRAG